MSDQFKLTEEERRYFYVVARDMFGPGYVAHFYEDFANDFIAACEWVLERRAREEEELVSPEKFELGPITVPPVPHLDYGALLIAMKLAFLAGVQAREVTASYFDPFDADEAWTEFRKGALGT